MLSKEKASQLALLFDGEIPEGIFQGGEFYFDIFDFSIIPVELISGIYESLIDEETKKLDSAVYTPSFLVEYILSNTVDAFFQDDKNKQLTECKVFDPSAGSGIFLVQAFRRMVDREIQQNKSKKITRNRLREIVNNNLFGIDINEQALKVTCFSIYIAMLDYFEPNSILPKFEFPNLIGSNLFTANFFNEKHAFNTVINSKGVDFILGNPPWKNDKDKYHINWLKENNKTVGGFEIAQSFLLRSNEFMQMKTISALIVTSTIFYNVSTKTKIFKQEFLRQFCVDRFFDLSAVRRLVFEEKNSPCSIVFYRRSNNDNYMNNVVKHFSVKSNLFLKYYKTLVIEKFDQEEILQKHFIENDWMFKVALYGNTLDFVLLKKIEENKYKVSDLIDGQKIVKGAGIKSNKGKHFADFLIGMPIVENGSIADYYTPVTENYHRLRQSDVYYESGRKKELFFGNKILIKEQARNESDLVISYCDKNIVYKNGVWGISSNDNDLIKLIYSILISKLYTYFIYITSCSWGVSTRPQIRLDEELLSFPYKKHTKKSEEMLIDLINRFLEGYKGFYNKFSLGTPHRDEEAFDKINILINNLYNISGYEKDLIDYVLEISRYQFQESKQQKVIRKVHDDNKSLEAYADVFFNEFSNLYEDEYLQVEVFPLNHFIAMNFFFLTEKPDKRVIIKEGATKEKDVFRAISNNISISEVSKKLFVQKDIKGFEENSFYIIKPNEYKCWHRAMAWYDVAEIKQTIEEAEIGYIKENFNV